MLSTRQEADGSWTVLEMVNFPPEGKPKLIGFATEGLAEQAIRDLLCEPGTTRAAGGKPLAIPIRRDFSGRREGSGRIVGQG